MAIVSNIRGVSLKDHGRSEKVRAEIGVAQIRDKVKEARLRWFGHVKRNDSYIKIAYEMEVIGKRNRGRQKIRLGNYLTKDMQVKKRKKKDALDRERYKNKIKVPDPQISCN